MSLAVVILAAGQGTRMRSRLPKVLHPIGGQPMLVRVITAARQLEANTICVVYGHHGAQVQAAVAGHASVDWVEQLEQLGTGHAVQQAIPNIAGHDHTLVLYGDVPLIEVPTLQRLLAELEHAPLALLTMFPDSAQGYGRIVRGDGDMGAIERIVEERDATDAERRIPECNSGILAARTDALIGWLERLRSNNAQHELYLTDVVGLAVGDGERVASAQPDRIEEVLGVNDRVQLARLEREHQRLEAEALMRAGITLADPDRFDLRGSLTAGSDTSIDIDCVFEGRVVLGEGCRIGPHCVIRDAVIGERVEIRAFSVIEGAEIGDDCIIGPYARLRPGAVLAEQVHVGNFVEIKNSRLGVGAKANHLSYLGDATVGRRVNVGAGTITCNYDGANKHHTTIGDDAFIGSNTALVAPVTVGEGATIGAGSTISADVPPGTLALTRPEQRSLKHWKRPKKDAAKT
ncbi:MAG: bifunctional UDP-N-acetylglucosamine diphosphorylase/glucosamine-1-phosphate N-acetyltransferase GlmU [Chromatiales bacterium]|nr:bifunctional UDP-N-acetylglucosamine diphosphorylase/glucosamine-1-phosphate N-acetyltransferase GlmU [Chromatiales bacterium]